MKREKKVYIGFWADKTIKEKIEQLAKERRLPASYLIREMLRESLNLKNK